MNFLRKYIRDLWIVSKSGVVLFENKVSDQINPDLFGSMMSALNMYANNLSEGGLSSFDMDDNRYVLIKEKSYQFITKTLNTFKVKNIKKELKDIADKFFELHPQLLKNDWEGGLTSKFTSFKKEL